MPGKTWKDLKRNSAKSLAKNKPTQKPKNSKHAKENAFELAKKSSPELASLLDKREELENNLHNLSSGEGKELSLRDAARFRVQTFAERQAQLRQWESKREQLRAHTTELRIRSRNKVLSYEQNKQESTDNSINQWLAHRDTQRRYLRRTAQDRLSPLNDITPVGRRINNSLSSASDQLRDLDKRLTKEASQDSNTIHNLRRNNKELSKYTKIAEASMRKVDKIDQFWKKRQQQISGQMDKVGAYFNHSKHQLSTRTGGSGDLFERMDHNRETALKRSREKCKEEARDIARCEHAQHSRRKKKLNDKEYS